MANSLTGEFDLVAEFSLPAVNRILAAMHQCERFLHSTSERVDDNPPPGLGLPRPVVTGIVDTFGDPISNQRQIAGFVGVASGAATAARLNLGGIVNPEPGEFSQGTIEPSHIQGRAQLQLFPPTVDVPDASGQNLSVTMNVMARYFPDPNTAPLAEFIRGDVQITAPVNQITSEVGNVVDFDFKADQAQVNFTPSYSSKPLSAEDVAGIDLLIHNALKTSFLPSSATLPSGADWKVKLVQFKALTGSQKALAVLLNLSSHGSNWDSVSKVFLHSGDDFALAAGRDFVLAVLQPVVDNILGQSIQHITLKSASFDLQPGKIVLAVKGHASTPVGDTDFTATLDFSLRAVGPAINLVPGGVSLGDLSNPIVALANWITGDGTKAVTSARDQALSSGAFNTASDAFDVNASLGKFLNSLLNPDLGSGPPQQSVVLTYTGVDIQPSGITAHGSLWLLFQWPRPYVEFEQIPSTSGGHGALGGQIGTLGHGPDYSALKTWIPGGRIDQYEWSVSVNNQLYPFGVDPNKFVLLHSGPVVAQAGETGGSLPPYQSLCLTVRGTRLSSQGPVVPESVSGSVCGYTHTPVIAPGLVVQTRGLKAMPMLALTRPNPSGQVAVTGYTLARMGAPAAPTPNLILHFGDKHSAAELKLISRALKDSKHHRRPAVVIAVLPSGQLAQAPFTDGVVYADDRSGAWALLFGLRDSRRPYTVIVDPKGKITWQHDGALKHETLVAALSKSLVDTHNVPIGLAGVNVRINHVAPNFRFEYAPGRDLTLNKLSGWKELVFWRSSSEPSIQAVLDAQKAACSDGKSKTNVLAINDGESSETARRVAAESGITATLVTDPERQISLPYGVDLWPTRVTVNPSGVITVIAYGYLAEEHADPVGQKTTAGR